MDGDMLIGQGDMYEQNVFIIRKREKALHEAGAALTDVVRTRVFVTDIAQREEAGKAHGEFFKDIKPVATLIEISKRIHDDLLLEIEMTAVLQNH